MNRFRWPTDKSIDSASNALSSWLGTPASNWSEWKAWAISSAPRSYWWTGKPHTRAFARRVSSWIAAEISRTSAAKKLSSS
ncbi:MAG TPA: hypothetical protein VF033_07025 [Steroidobacteraceae bacterium]